MILLIAVIGLSRLHSQELFPEDDVFLKIKSYPESIQLFIEDSQERDRVEGIVKVVA